MGRDSSAICRSHPEVPGRWHLALRPRWRLTRTAAAPCSSYARAPPQVLNWGALHSCGALRLCTLTVLARWNKRGLHSVSQHKVWCDPLSRWFNLFEGLRISTCPAQMSFIRSAAHRFRNSPWHAPPCLDYESRACSRLMREDRKVFVGDDATQPPFNFEQRKRGILGNLTEAISSPPRSVGSVGPAYPTLSHLIGSPPYLCCPQEHSPMAVRHSTEQRPHANTPRNLKQPPRPGQPTTMLAAR